MPVPAERRPLGVLLASGTHAKAHFAFMLAAGAAALGREVTLFASNLGCHALLEDWSGLEDAGRDARAAGAGAAGLDELRAAVAEMGVRLLVCETGLRIEGLAGAALMPGAEVAGIVTFLESVGGGQIVSL